MKGAAFSGKPDDASTTVASVASDEGRSERAAYRREAAACASDEGRSERAAYRREAAACASGERSDP